MADGSLDVAFLMEGLVRSASLRSEVLAKEPLVVLGPPDHRLASLARVDPDDLEGEQILLTGPGCNYRLMSERELAALRWAGEQHKIPVQMIWHKDKWISPTLAAFLEMSREMIPADGLKTAVG